MLYDSTTTGSLLHEEQFVMRGGGVLVVVGLVWLAAVILLVSLTPKEFFYSWHATGTKRIWIMIAIVLFGLGRQLFIVGWLVPLGLGLYRLFRK